MIQKHNANDHTFNGCMKNTNYNYCTTEVCFIIFQNNLIAKPSFKTIKEMQKSTSTENHLLSTNETFYYNSPKGDINAWPSNFQILFLYITLVNNHLGLSDKIHYYCENSGTYHTKIKDIICLVAFTTKQ